MPIYLAFFFLFEQILTTVQYIVAGTRPRTRLSEDFLPTDIPYDGLSDGNPSYLSFHSLNSND